MTLALLLLIDRFTYLQLQLHQLQPAAVLQIVNVDGRAQVIPFVLRPSRLPCLRIRIPHRCCSSISRDAFRRVATVRAVVGPVRRSRHRNNTT